MTSKAPSELDRFREGIEQICQDVLGSYTNSLDRRSAPHTSKEFNDSVWGTIVLFPLEVVVLDSPLLQRLRRIRQLGVAHLVYPGAMHTRFEHTLGIVHQISRLITSINSRAPETIDLSNTRLLRMIALCHDVGHGLMSHVSEKALDNFEQTEVLKLAFADTVQKENAKLNEIVSYFMIGSPAFASLLSKAIEVTDDHSLEQDAIGLMQNAVVGKPISNEIPLLHELISGPFDADKLDYMPRDAQMTGVPVVTDISRLMQKVRAVKVGRSAVPRDIAEHVEGNLPSYVLIGIDRSGGRTLDELMLGRTLLFDKIYRHQKVRAAEVMVASILALLADALGEDLQLLPYKVTDDELLSIRERVITLSQGRELTPTQQRQLTVADELAQCLNRRDLFVRSYAFAQSMPLDPYRVDPEQQVGLERLLRAAADREGRTALMRQIADQTTSILNLAEQTNLLTRFSVDGRLDPYIWIDPPETSTNVSDVSRALLIGEDQRLTRFKDDSAETRGWADAYLLTRDIGYVYAPRDLSLYVFLAAEKVTREQFGVRTPKSMVAYAKQDFARVQALKRQLSSKGLYNDLPHDIRPLPARLEKLDIEQRIEVVMNNLRGYVGPVRPDDELMKETLVGERVIDWLRQFEEDDLIDAALTALQHCRLIGRTELTTSLRLFLDVHEEYHKGTLCILGTPKDSSAVATYYANDVARQYGLSVASLEAGLGIGEPIVFVDDFISTGQQAISIVETWLGVEQSYDLGEERGKALSAVLQNVLRDSRLAFVFAAGTTAGKSLLESRCAELGLQAVVGVAIQDGDLPRAFGASIFRNERQENAFKDRCAEIGTSLLTDDEHDEAWARARALGYGNQGYLVVFPYNTPSQTLTCIWAAGTSRNTAWKPLFPRRKKE